MTAKTPASEPRFDLLIKHGTVVDPGAGIDGSLDVAISNGRIAEVAPRIPIEEAHEIVDASGHYVVPGLIDLHTHVYPGVTYWGVDPGPIAARTGVTTWVDAGSAGAFTMRGFYESVAQPSRPQIYAFLNISCVGLVSQDYELAILDHCDVDLFLRTAETYPHLIVGAKVRMATPTIGRNGLEPLRRARRAADECGLPLMVHIAVGPPAIEDVVDLMGTGDILTHCFTGQSMRIVDAKGRLIEPVARARESGVIMDVGHGAGSFSFETAERLFDAGFQPDVISSDLHQLSQYGSALDPQSEGFVARVHGGPSHASTFDLPTCMSKLLGLGMSFSEVVRATTSTPARVLGLADEIGTLRPGARGDVALLTREQGSFPVQDTHGNVRVLPEMIRSSLTIAGGEQLSRLEDSPPPPWVRFIEEEEYEGQARVRASPTL